MRITTKDDRRHRIQLRQRKRIQGTSARPRLSVFRSLKHIYAQVIDDSRGVTLAAASTVEAAMRDGNGTGKTARAQAVGELVARRALEHGVDRVVFDRGGYMFHGRVKALAEAARAAGLQF